MELEAASRFELENNGFADRRLTTWLCRLRRPGSFFESGSGEKEDGAGNGIRTRDIHLGKVELYH
jgi:hypothetical protein